MSKLKKGGFSAILIEEGALGIPKFFFKAGGKQENPDLALKKTIIVGLNKHIFEKKTIIELSKQIR